MLIRTANVLRRLDKRWTDGVENRKLRALSAPASPPSRRFQTMWVFTGRLRKRPARGRPSRAALSLSGSRGPGPLAPGSSLTPSSSFRPAPKRIMIPTATCGAVSHSTRCKLPMPAPSDTVADSDSDGMPPASCNQPAGSLRPSTSSGWAGPRGAPVLEKKWPKVLKKST